jgi:hypothetical protein
MMAIVIIKERKCVRLVAYTEEKWWKRRDSSPTIFIVDWTIPSSGYSPEESVYGMVSILVVLVFY